MPEALQPAAVASLRGAAASTVAAAMHQLWVVSVAAGPWWRRVPLQQAAVAWVRGAAASSVTAQLLLGSVAGPSVRWAAVALLLGSVAGPSVRWAAVASVVGSVAVPSRQVPLAALAAWAAMEAVALPGAPRCRCRRRSPPHDRLHRAPPS